jgi:hypothetical protein
MTIKSTFFFCVACYLLHLAYWMQNEPGLYCFAVYSLLLTVAFDEPTEEPHYATS